MGFFSNPAPKVAAPPLGSNSSHCDCRAGRVRTHVIWLFLTTTWKDRRDAPLVCVRGHNVRVHLLRSRTDVPDGGTCTNEGVRPLVPHPKIFAEVQPVRSSGSASLCFRMQPRHVHLKTAA